MYHLIGANIWIILLSLALMMFEKIIMIVKKNHVYYTIE